MVQVALYAPDYEIMPGVRWGRADEPLSPAYWAALGLYASPNDGFHNPNSTLEQEVVFCLLGGYGIKAEVNLAAYERLFANNIINSNERISANQIENLLREPLTINGRNQKYRFPRQRSVRIAEAILILKSHTPTGDGLELRRWLMRIPGIGYKTASWITRNYLGSDQVAIIDIHVVRACQAMKLFDVQIKLPKDYEELEKRFIAFSNIIGVKASILDAIIWRQMRSISHLLNRPNVS